jgi:hypothetical protein
MCRKIRCDRYCANFFGLHGQLNRPKPCGRANKWWGAAVENMKSGSMGVASRWWRASATRERYFARMWTHDLALYVQPASTATKGRRKGCIWILGECPCVVMGQKIYNNILVHCRCQNSFNLWTKVLYNSIDIYYLIYRNQKFSIHPQNFCTIT